MGYGRQVSFRENPNRWNFKSDRDFRTLAATVYQSEVRVCTPTDWYLKKRVLNGRVRWNVVFCRTQAQQTTDLVGTWQRFQRDCRDACWESRSCRCWGIIERFNLTLRQRISRLVRKTLSFSKKIEAHIGAIWNFIHNYNAEIASKLAITTH